MKLVTYQGEAGPRLGALVPNGHILDLRKAADLRGLPGEAVRSMQGLIEAGAAGLDQAQALLADAEATPEALSAASSAKLLAPLPRPEQIRDCLSFEAHLRNSMDSTLEFLAAQSGDVDAARQRLRASGRFDIPKVWYEIPLYYKANRFAVSGPDQDVLWPAYSERLDYELELAAVIGAPGRDIARSRAHDHIFGYTIFNDFSARDAQLRETAGGLGPAKGKDFDTANAFGPCIVTADEVTDPYALSMVARVNGEERCRGSSSAMHHRFDAILAHISQSETLHPGEIICSGTVGGGSGLEINRYLNPGDVVELEIEQIGVLRNRVVRPS